MRILNKLGGHTVVEDNNLNGIRQGHMLSQMPFDTAGNADLNGELDNGYILEVTDEMKLTLHDGGTGAAYLHYSEEYIAFLESASLDMFYLDIAKGDIPRAIALVNGDSFTTDRFKSEASAALVDGKVYGGKIAGGVITVTDATEDAIMLIQKATLASGKDAVKVFWRGA